MKPSRKSNRKTPLSRDQMSMDTDRLMKHIESLNLGSIEEINKYMQEHVIGKRIDDVLSKVERPHRNTSAREQADDIMYQAYGAPLQKGIQLTKKALDIDPENVRALIFQAEHETGTKALDLFRKAESLARQQLGDRFFEEHKGHFWGMTETRPYMKAKMGIANMHYGLGYDDKAIDVYHELIDLNPNDNQGVRFRLSSLLLKNKMLSDFNKLYGLFIDDSSCHMGFNYALFLFATQGDQSISRQAISQSHADNKYVIPMLIGEDFSYRFSVSFETYTLGSKEEAILYLEDSIDAWKVYDGAIDWLKVLFQG